MGRILARRAPSLVGAARAAPLGRSDPEWTKSPEDHVRAKRGSAEGATTTPGGDAGRRTGAECIRPSLPHAATPEVTDSQTSFTQQTFVALALSVRRGLACSDCVS
jgi:hypothetical protein